MIYAVKCSGCHSDFPPLKFGNEFQRSEWMEAHTQAGPGHDDFGIWAERR